MNKKLLLAFLLASSPALSAELPCQTRSDVVAACHEVEGTLRLYNGTPSARIAINNTRRILGVESYIDEQNETFVAPLQVRQSVAFYHPLSGKFLVCPLNKPQPGRMQSVCIEAAKSTQIMK